MGAAAPSRGMGLRRSVGFTMVELITVMLVIGILGGIVAQRFFERQSFDARTFADQMRAMLRYGQKLAIAQNRPVYVGLTSTSVFLCFAVPGSGTCASTSQVSAPGLSNSASSVTLAACSNSKTWYCEGIPGGIAYSASPATSYFYFDALGKPFAAADASPTTVSTFALLSILITGDGSTRNVYVEPETGYVHS